MYACLSEDFLTLLVYYVSFGAEMVQFCAYLNCMSYKISNFMHRADSDFVKMSRKACVPYDSKCLV